MVEEDKNNNRKEKECVKQEPSCESHGKPLELFCEENSCRKALCALCMTEPKHKGHNLVAYEEGTTEAKIVLKELMEHSELITKAWGEHKIKLQLDVTSQQNCETTKAI